MDVDQILIKIHQNNTRNLHDFAELMPDLVKSRRRQYGRISKFIHSTLLQFIVLTLRLVIVPDIPKYVFQGLRHRHLIEVLPASEVMVLGGRNEFLYCRKMGYRFHWIGYIAKSFELFFWAGKKKPISQSIFLIQQFFNSSNGKNKYLFLWEDTLPVGLTLSTSLSNIPGLNIVCIAHGYFCKYKDKNIIAEGMNCKFNFVFDASQRKYFKNENGPSPFVLGVPYEITPPKTLARKVILVGHCGRSSDVEKYFFSLYHFYKIFIILKRAGFDVSFRPHPQDDLKFINSVFSDISVGDILELFNSKRMVYIGFASSLLYEARQFGNIVIGLDTSEFDYNRDFDVDGVILANKYEELPSYLSDLLDKHISISKDKSESLYSRFLDCIRQVDDFNLNNVKKPAL